MLGLVRVLEAAVAAQAAAALDPASPRRKEESAAGVTVRSALAKFLRSSAIGVPIVQSGGAVCMFVTGLSLLPHFLCRPTWLVCSSAARLQLFSMTARLLACSFQTVGQFSQLVCDRSVSIVQSVSRWGQRQACEHSCEPQRGGSGGGSELRRADGQTA